jgi:hypothetical protein
MAILAIARNFNGDPNIVTMVTDDTAAEITTNGFFTGPVISAQVEALQNGVFETAVTDLWLIYLTDGIGFYTYDSATGAFVALTGNAGLSSTLSSGNVFVGNASNVATGVAMTGDIGISNAGVTAIQPGVIVNSDINAAAAIDFSKLASLASGNILVGSAGAVPTSVAMSGATTISNAGVVTLNPVAQLGSSGVASSLKLFPPTATNGFLELLPVNAGANFNTIVSNGVMGQTTTYTIPDILASTGGIVVSTAAVRMKSVDAAAAAGGAAAQSFTDAFCTTTSVVIGNWVTQANAASVLKIVPGNGSFVVTSSADAGVGTFSYIIQK